jgi:hypothetical protein
MGFAVNSPGPPTANKPFSNNAVDPRADRAINFRRLSIVVAFIIEIRDKEEKSEEQSGAKDKRKKDSKLLSPSFSALMLLSSRLIPCQKR